MTNNERCSRSATIATRFARSPGAPPLGVIFDTACCTTAASCAASTLAGRGIARTFVAPLGKPLDACSMSFITRSISFGLPRRRRLFDASSTAIVTPPSSTGSVGRTGSTMGLSVDDGASVGGVAIGAPSCATIVNSDEKTCTAKGMRGAPACERPASGGTAVGVGLAASGSYRLSNSSTEITSMPPCCDSNMRRSNAATSIADAPAPSSGTERNCLLLAIDARSSFATIFSIAAYCSSVARTSSELLDTFTRMTGGCSMPSSISNTSFSAAAISAASALRTSRTCTKRVAPPVGPASSCRSISSAASSCEGVALMMTAFKRASAATLRIGSCAACTPPRVNARP